MQHLKRKIKIVTEIIVAVAMIYVVGKTYYGKRIAPDKPAPAQTATKSRLFHAQNSPQDYERNAIPIRHE